MGLREDTGATVGLELQFVIEHFRKVYQQAETVRRIAKNNKYEWLEAFKAQRDGLSLCLEKEPFRIVYNK